MLCYWLQNPDLQHFNLSDATTHYYAHGKRENRRTDCEGLNFDDQFLGKIKKLLQINRQDDAKQYLLQTTVESNDIQRSKPLFNLYCNSQHAIKTYDNIFSIRECSQKCDNHDLCHAAIIKNEGCTLYNKCKYKSIVYKTQRFYIKKGILKFDTCGGYTNQRLSIVYGLYIAKQLAWNVILPVLNYNGEQLGMEYREIGQKMANFTVFYKIPALNGVQWVNEPKHPSNRLDINDKSLVGILKSVLEESRFVHISCPLFKFRIEKQEFDNINEHLQPSEFIQRKVDNILQKLPVSFNMLHYRMESDWIEHCNRWSGNNCMTNSKNMQKTMLIEGVKPKYPIYINGKYEDDELFFLENQFHQENFVQGLEREVGAAVDYHVALKSKRFIGNSVSTFSALLLHVRKNGDDFHYNGGSIPIHEAMFSDYTQRRDKLTKWVFVYSSKTSYYNDMIKVALKSALKYTTIVPVCIYYGHLDEMYGYFVRKGVRVIIHTPSWIPLMKNAFAQTQKNKNTASTYDNIDTLIATYLRIDIPILGFIDDYVLYTDTDVMFLTNPSMPMKPFHYLNGPETQIEDCRRVEGDKSVLYGNAGVMLYNIENMRSTHAKFVNWIFSTENMKKGFHHGIYGPADQGAYNEFYASSFTCIPRPLFNWKAYWPGNDEVQIVHFHGPKPNDYRKYLENNIVTREVYRGLLSNCKDKCKEYIDVFHELLKESFLT